MSILNREKSFIFSSLFIGNSFSPWSGFAMSDTLDITLKARASQNSVKFGYLDFTDGGNVPDIESSSDRVDFALELGFPFLVQADTFWETITLYAFPSLGEATRALAKLSPRCYVSEVMQFSPIA